MLPRSPWLLLKMQFDRLTRGQFIALLGSTTAVWPFAARAQPAELPVIGFLSNGTQESDAVRLAPFREGLKEAGYVERRNVSSEYRGAEDHADRLPVLAADLLLRSPAVLVALGGASSSLAAKRATTTVPIIFIVAGDPVELGLVASIKRPGGNVTGVTTAPDSIVAKQLETLYETIPTATVIGCLLNPTNPNLETQKREAQKATRALGLKLELLLARSDAEIETAFTTFVQKRVSGLVVAPDGFFTNRSEQVVALAARHALPAIFPYREFARAGGLMSYGSNVPDGYRQAGIYAGRILKGEKPADLPVIQLAKIELIINVNTANALGIRFPLSLFARADEVIE
jgi:putative tryptophan/tyrosine transport system substrate-binding protein